MFLVQTRKRASAQDEDSLPAQSKRRAALLAMGAKCKPADVAMCYGVNREKVYRGVADEKEKQKKPGYVFPRLSDDEILSMLASVTNVRAAVKTAAEVISFPGPNKSEAELKKILLRLDACKLRMDISMYVFTNEKLVDAVIRAKQERDVVVRVITDSRQMKCPSSLVRKFLETGIPVRSNRHPSQLMHHKYVIIDSSVLMHGSFNWSHNALTNDEDLTIQSNTIITALHQSRFDKRWAFHDPISLSALEANTFLCPQCLAHAHEQTQQGTQLEPVPAAPQAPQPTGSVQEQGQPPPQDRSQDWIRPQRKKSPRRPSQAPAQEQQQVSTPPRSVSLLRSPTSPATQPPPRSQPPPPAVPASSLSLAQLRSANTAASIPAAPLQALDTTTDMAATSPTAASSAPSQSNPPATGQSAPPRRDRSTSTPSTTRSVRRGRPRSRQAPDSTLRSPTPQVPQQGFTIAVPIPVPMYPPFAPTIPWGFPRWHNSFAWEPGPDQAVMLRSACDKLGLPTI